VSFISYSNKALVQNEFDANIVFSNGKTGMYVIETYGLGTPSLWVCVIINIALSIFNLTVGFIAFNRTSAPLHRLK
jgi:hypothetical protein